MFRPVNAEEALSLLQRRSGASLVLEGDDEIPENAGSCTVGGSNGHVIRSTRAGEWLTFDMRKLAQL